MFLYEYEGQSLSNNVNHFLNTIIHFIYVFRNAHFRIHPRIVILYVIVDVFNTFWVLNVHIMSRVVYYALSLCPRRATNSICEALHVKHTLRTRAISECPGKAAKVSACERLNRKCTHWAMFDKQCLRRTWFFVG